MIMIQANELRYGNYVMYNDKIYRVVGFLGGTVWLEGLDITLNINELGGIEITKESMKELNINVDDDGVDVYAKVFPYPSNVNAYLSEDGLLDIGTDDGLSIVDVKYIHQLQNICFDINKEEI